MRYGLIVLAELQKEIAKRAYYKWLDGSQDSNLNWYLAEQELFNYMLNNLKGDVCEQ